MQNDLLFRIVDEYFDKNPPPYFSFDYGTNISPKKLRNARKRYANYDVSIERPLLLIDDTLFRSASMGIVVTNIHMYYRLRKDKDHWDKVLGKLALDDIWGFRIETFRNGSNLFINNELIASISAFGTLGYKKHEADLINKLFVRILDAIKAM